MTAQRNHLVRTCHEGVWGRVNHVACDHLSLAPSRHLGPAEVVSGCSLNRSPALEGPRNRGGTDNAGDRGAGRGPTTRSGRWRWASGRRRLDDGGTTTGRRRDDDGTTTAAGTPDASVPWECVGPPQVTKASTNRVGSPLRGTEVPLRDQPREGAAGSRAAGTHSVGTQKGGTPFGDPALAEP